MSGSPRHITTPITTLPRSTGAAPLIVHGITPAPCATKITPTMPRTSPTVPAALLMLFHLLLGSIGPVQASDSGLQRALLGAKCGSPRVERLLQRGDVVLYEVNCFGTSHRILTVTCLREACSVERLRPNEDGQ